MRVCKHADDRLEDGHLRGHVQGGQRPRHALPVVPSETSDMHVRCLRSTNVRLQELHLG